MASLNPARMSREEVEKWIKKYISGHHRPKAGEEAYEFNIKVRRIDVPEIAHHKFTNAEIDQQVQTAMAGRLGAFVADLMEDYPWIENWGQEGRTGGWLVLITHEPVIDLYDEIQKSELVSARNRLKDLFEIDNSIRENIKSMQQEFSSLKWWGIGPLDWLPGMKRR